jgi:outer membrane biogenesis lipoprotein LolB
MLKYLLIASFVFIAHGCTSLEPSRPVNSDSALQNVERWQGRFNALIEGTSDQTTVGEGANSGSTSPSFKRESITGRFELSITQARADPASKRTVLELSSPLGQLVARLSIEPGKARLETADRGDFSAPDMDSLTDSMLGWRVPVQRMSVWLQGKATENSVIDAQGKLVSAIDGGWSLTIDEHNAQGKPAKLTLNNSINNGSGGQTVSGISKVRLRLLLD